MELSKELLEKLYNEHRLSMAEIAGRLGCSQNKVAYWMVKYGIPRREINEAIYQWINPDGDPFSIKPLETEEERELLHLALGLYIGEGKKKSDADISIARVAILQTGGSRPPGWNLFEC